MPWTLPKILVAAAGWVAWAVLWPWIRLRARRLAGSKDWRAKGRFGETVACLHLWRSGCRVVERNWRGGGEELDLVGWEGDTLVVIEVKTRAAGRFLPGGWAVTYGKRLHLRRGVRHHLAAWRPRPLRWRMDIVEVELGGPAGVRVYRWRLDPESPGWADGSYRPH